MAFVRGRIVVYTIRDLDEWIDSCRYGVIYADPPWQFRSWSDKGRNRCPDAPVRQKGLSERHYKVISLDDIKSLPVEDLTAPNCALFLWTVDCHLPEALAVEEAWGFTFKTVAFSWVRPWLSHRLGLLDTGQPRIMPTVH